MLVVRSKLLTLLIHTAAACAGVLLYATGQYAAMHWPELRELLRQSGTGVQVCLVLGALLELTLLGAMLSLPFLSRCRAELKETFGVSLLGPRVYLLIWAAGSLAYHVVAVVPQPGTSPFAGLGGPLGAVAVVLAVGVLMPPKKTGGAPAPDHEEPARPEVKEAGATAGGEEQQLRERVEELHREMEQAERRWAATVLEERAARIRAERYAKEFADARRAMNGRSSSAARRLPSTMTLPEALRVLRLVPGCTPDQARDAYHRLLVKYHPDKLDLFGSAIRETGEQETKRLNMAYDLVKRSFQASPAHRPF